jgi:hypothetical protein
LTALSDGASLRQVCEISGRRHSWSSTRFVECVRLGSPPSTSTRSPTTRLLPAAARWGKGGPKAHPVGMRSTLPAPGRSRHAHRGGERSRFHPRESQARADSSGAWRRSSRRRLGRPRPQPGSGQATSGGNRWPECAAPSTALVGPGWSWLPAACAIAASSRVRDGRSRLAARSPRSTG